MALERVSIKQKKLHKKKEKKMIHFEWVDWTKR